MLMQLLTTAPVPSIYIFMAKQMMIMTTTDSTQAQTDTTDIARKLAAGLLNEVPFPGNLAGTALFDLLWPGADATDKFLEDWNAIEPALENMVARELVQNNINKAESYLQSYLVYVKAECSNEKDPKTYTKLSSCEFGDGSGGLVDAVHTLMYDNDTIDDCGTLQHFMSAASIHLSNISEMVKLGGDLDSDIPALKSYVTLYCDYIDKALKRIVDKRMSLISTALGSNEENNITVYDYCDDYYKNIDNAKRITNLGRYANDYEGAMAALKAYRLQVYRETIDQLIDVTNDVYNQWLALSMHADFKAYDHSSGQPIKFNMKLGYGSKRQAFALPDFNLQGMHIGFTDITYTLGLTEFYQGIIDYSVYLFNTDNIDSPQTEALIGWEGYKGGDTYLLAPDNNYYAAFFPTSIDDRAPSIVLVEFTITNQETLPIVN